ncbi:MAG: DNA ligase D [Burkholderiales bacterium]|nr:DNA ligase D [Burkholderiales bacterium]
MKAASNRPLKKYTEKRDFSTTPEPPGDRPGDMPEAAANPGPLTFVVQKHWASRLHYDFRLELEGVLVSWALPKGPSYDPAEKRMAVHVEDHPVSYGSFEGTIPKGQYGAGRVIVWDRGHWEPVAPTADARAGMAAGKLVIRLHGDKLAGLWELVRIGKPGDRQESWMLFKKRDAWARPTAEYDVVTALPDSVVDKPLGRIEERQPRIGAGIGAGIGAAAGAGAGAGGTTGATAAVGAAATAHGAAQGATQGVGPRRAADLPGALPAAELPATLAPQLATATEAPPARGEWLYELKLDGYRLLARADAAGRVTLHTRNGHDWTAKLKPLAAAVAACGLRSTWLDGEIVVQRDDGTPDFNALQNAIDSGSSSTRQGSAAITYFLFDLPFCDGHDLRRVPLYARRALLRQRLEARGCPGASKALAKAAATTVPAAAAVAAADGTDGAAPDPLRFSADFAADPASLLESARTLGLEGIIAKRADAPYVSRRSDSWLKLKIGARQELVIGGFTERQGSAREVGSLILGVYDAQGRLEHAGSVGTGWDAAAAARLRERLAPLERREPPFAAGSPDPGRWSRRASGSERWVRPELVAEVRFAGWTPAGHVRHAVFVALREDKPARSVTRERVVDEAALAAMASAMPAAPNIHAARASRLKVTHAERIIDPATGLTKLHLVRYYESIAERLLPHLAGRPVSLVRGPDGITGQLFFQKHDEAGSIPGLMQLAPALWPGHSPLLAVPDADALLAAAQMNVIEFHTWNSTVKKINQPDRVIFDLDPGEGVPWERVREAAMLTRTLLDELGLAAWLKTSGGKGLHVVVPITPSPKFDHDTVKAFSQAAVVHLARTIPSRFVARSGAANRVGKIFVDYLRNGHGATTAAAFSARARPGLGVSMPIAWDELPGLKSAAQWNIATAREHLSFQQADPWAGYFGAKQTLGQAMKVLGLPPLPSSLAKARESR